MDPDPYVRDREWQRHKKFKYVVGTVCTHTLICVQCEKSVCLKMTVYVR